MAINQLNDYSVGDASIDDVMVTLDATRRGHIALTLTNMDSTGVPAIAAGSIVEVGGALFEFTTDTALSGSPSDGTVYIKLVPSGTAPTITLTPTMTNTAPTWSDAKQGWYGTLTAAGDRYVGRMSKSSSDYFNKVLIKEQYYRESYEEILTEAIHTSRSYQNFDTTFSNGIYVSEGNILLINYKIDIDNTYGSGLGEFGLYVDRSSTARYRNINQRTAKVPPASYFEVAYQVFQPTPIGTGTLYCINSLSYDFRAGDIIGYNTYNIVDQIYIEKSGMIKIQECVVIGVSGARVKNRKMFLKIIA